MKASHCLCSETDAPAQQPGLAAHGGTLHPSSSPRTSVLCLSTFTDEERKAQDGYKLSMHRTSEWCIRTQTQVKAGGQSRTHAYNPYPTRPLIRVQLSKKPRSLKQKEDTIQSFHDKASRKSAPPASEATWRQSASCQVTQSPLKTKKQKQTKNTAAAIIKDEMRTVKEKRQAGRGFLWELHF